MKKVIAIILLILFAFAFVGCNNSSKDSKIEVYTFSGENEYFYVSGGAAVLNGEEEVFSGGELKLFKEEAFSDVYCFSTSFYIVDGAEKRYVLMNVVEDIPGGASVSISGDLGKISGGNVISEYKSTDMEAFINNLYFELAVTDSQGIESTYELKLNVEKIY